MYVVVQFGSVSCDLEMIASVALLEIKYITTIDFQIMIFVKGFAMDSRKRGKEVLI